MLSPLPIVLTSCWRPPYDFGDGRDHELAVEASVVADAVTVHPACTGGGGACPPEDCAGPGAVRRLKDLLAGPRVPNARRRAPGPTRTTIPRASTWPRQRRGGLSLSKPARPDAPARSEPRPPPVRHVSGWPATAGPHRLPPRSPGIPDHRAVPSGTR